MFKSLLPSKRISSSEFQMLTQLAEDPSGKENKPTQPTATTSKKKRQASVAQPKEDVFGAVQGTNQAFDRLLDDLQIPSTLRPKLATMDSTVKAAMLKSSAMMALAQPATPPRTPKSTLRRTHSIDSISTPRASGSSLDEELPPPPPIFSAMNIGNGVPSNGIGSSPRRPSAHTRGSSFDLPRVFSRSQVNLSTVTLNDMPAGSKLPKDKAALGKAITPTKFVSILSSTSSTQLDVDNVKKLRLMLRNEPASWTQEFLHAGGYTALLTRLNELLEIEWREEQHDDQVLHELLRCVKALSTSSIGCCALRSSSTTPFAQLISLLYSDKKPGDVATRQLIVDLLLVLFDLYPSSALPSSSSGFSYPRREVWDEEYSPASSTLITLPAPHRNIFSLVRSLLLTPAPLAAEATAPPLSPHEFIESLHRPRIYKTYLQELSDVCRDYFWVFCHPNNTIWVLDQVDETKVEKPRAPGGMTGGVEFEAMNYFTTHMRFLNAVAKSTADLNLQADNDLSAHRFHSDLFSSGLERILLIARKASATYYPTLHLEISRYIALSAQAKYELPWTVSRLVGSPPSSVLKTVRSSNPSSPVRRTADHSSPTKRGVNGSSTGGPRIQTYKKVEPIRLD